LQLPYKPGNNTVVSFVSMPKAIPMRALASDLDALAGVCRRQAVRLLVAFGSTVRELRSPDSDLDLAVWMATADSAPQTLVRLEVALRPLFPGECLDLVLLNRASPLLQFQVALHGAVLFEAAPGVFHAFQVLASKRHADVAHLRSLDRVCVERFLRRQPSMIDRELVNRKLSQIVEYLTALTPLQALSYADYLQQPLPRYAAERLLQLLVDTAIDINAHLIVELTGTPPQDYYDSFVKAAQAGVLSIAFALSIAQSTGLRNRLVHQYEAIDHAIVHNAIAEAITQYTEYCRHITTFLDRHVLPPTA
jgi:uncharacterized protein YutE (UPF0331/DUF86 family)/predicted nucleotidyltransferase